MKFFIFILFFSKAVFAQQSFFNFLNELPKTVNTSNAIICDYSYFENQNNDYKLFHECALSLCGDPGTNPSTSLTNENFDQFISEEELKEFDELIPLVNERTKDAKEYFLKLAEKLSEGPKLLEHMDNAEISSLEMGVFSNFVSYEVDMSKPLKERLLPVVLKTGNKAINEGLDDYVKRQIAVTFSSPRNIYDAGIYTQDEALGALEKLYNHYMSLPKDNYGFEEDSSDDQNINQFYEAVRDQPDDEFLMGKLFTMLEDAIYFESQEYEDTDIYASNQVCFESEKCIGAIKTFVTGIDFQKARKDMKSILNSSNFESSFLADCKANYVSNFLEGKRNERFVQAAQSLKDNFTQRALGNLSPESQQKFNNYLNEKLNISYQFSKKGDKESFKRELEFVAYDNEQEIENLSALNTLLAIKGMNKRYFDPTPFMSICGSGSSSLMWDMFIPKGKDAFSASQYNDSDFDKDNIISSPFTCNHFDYGEGILAHELGHALSSNFHLGEMSQESSKEFMKLRKCANDNYPFYDLDKVNNSYGSFPGDKFRTEEDTADLISYAYLGKYQSGKKLTYCSMLSVSRSANRYINLEIDNIGMNDSHSSDLFRLLKEAVVRDAPLEGACQQVLNKYKQYGIKKCE